MREPFPLQWPDGWSRTAPDERKRSRFVNQRKERLGVTLALNEVLAELRRMGASNVVLTSNLPTRRDGLPYGDGRAGDPGIAVWFVLRDQERVFACDCWTTPADNMHAIALSIEALRGLERWGAADVVARAFAGFRALPAGDDAHAGTRSDPHTKRHWRDVLDVRSTDLTNVDLLAIVKARYRNLMKTAHPDAGAASSARAVELNIALEEATKDLTP